MKKARNAQLTGKTMSHKTLGKVLVNGATEGTITMVDVTCIDRGEGWNEDEQAYTGTAKKFGEGVVWQRGQNYQYGHKDSVHINTLN